MGARDASSATAAQLLCDKSGIWRTAVGHWADAVILLQHVAARVLVVVCAVKYRICTRTPQIYKGQLAAVKVVCDRDVDNGSLNGALELALLTSISHPNIIQIHTYYAGGTGGPGTRWSHEGGSGSGGEMLKKEVHVAEPARDAVVRTEYPLQRSQQ